MSELLFFMKNSEVEQRLHFQTHMVSIEDFWAFRLGTSAVRVVLCLNEYCNESSLPPHIMQHRDMGVLWDLTNVNICCVNDLLSMRKELDQGATESLIPVLCAKYLDAQAAADEVVAAVEHTVQKFNDVAARIIRHHSDIEDPEVVKDLVRFVEGCKYYCAGNLRWRYG